MINAAAADLIQRAEILNRKVSCSGMTDHDHFIYVAIPSIAKDQGTYLDSDVNLAQIAVDQLGIFEALQRARAINPLDEVWELFNALVKDLEDPDTTVDFDKAFKVAEEFSDYDRGRFLGMVNAYMSYGPPPMMTGEEEEKTQEMISDLFIELDAEEKQRRAMGFDNDQ